MCPPWPYRWCTGTALWIQSRQMSINSNALYRQFGTSCPKPPSRRQYVLFEEGYSPVLQIRVGTSSTYFIRSSFWMLTKRPFSGSSELKKETPFLTNFIPKRGVLVDKWAKLCYQWTDFDEIWHRCVELDPQLFLKVSLQADSRWCNYEIFSKVPSFYLRTLYILITSISAN